MAPEVIMAVFLIACFKTAYKEKGVKLLMAGFTVLLVWGGFFNDTWGYIVAGFKAIFG